MAQITYEFAWALRDSKGYYVTDLYNGFTPNGEKPHPLYGDMREAVRFASPAEAGAFLERMSRAHQRNFDIVRHHPPARWVDDKAT
jgi:hypothetical protein